MNKSQFLAGVTVTLACSLSSVGLTSAHAAERIKIQFWNAMSGELGKTVQHVVDEFNASQDKYEVVSVNKGSYGDTMMSAIAAFRAKNPPDIVQVFDVGTATMMAAKGAYVPVYDLMAKEGIPFSTSQFIEGAASYYSNAQGKLVSMPFNSSTPVLYYNKDLLAKAGVQPPRTWQEMGEAGQKLKAAGVKCGFTTGWPDWVQFEQFSLWNGIPYATQDNGFKSYKNVRLLLNDKPYVQHVADLVQWSKDGIFKYAGAGSTNATPLFNSGECAMYMDSSASFAAVNAGAKFPFGIAPMPYDAKLKTAPQNTAVGGASLWVMKGVAADHYAGIAKFLDFLGSAKTQSYWAKKTGYVPVSKAGFGLLKAEGFYEKNPGALVAIEELTHKPPKPFTMGIRLGYMPQIRDNIRAELEDALAGKKTAQQAMDAVVSKGDKLLAQFSQTSGQ
ncbi:MAG: sn-glycerol-3-phosphate ABC transporter substrate-binding protein UgpB [Thiomonas sp.]